MTFAPSQTIGKYEILGIIDKPKTGVTYKVRNLVTRNFEMLRALPGATAGNPENMQRFLREIKIHTRLSHPNILSFHDALQVEGQLVMTSEFVEGQTLTYRLKQGPIPWRDAVRHIGDVLSALEEAHSLGIVHRSITPDHVIVTTEGSVKVGGFGLAKPMTDLNLTQAGAVLGDPRYISPEQIAKPAAVDSRADLYSAGVLLYAALTGKPPFDGSNDYEIMVAQVSKAPELVNTGFPAALEQVLFKALAKEPRERFQTARDFREALAGIPGETAGEPSSHAPVTFGLSQPEARPGRRPIWIGVAALAVVLIIVVLLMLK
jgi:serine/threonine protein kinase